MSVVGYWLLSFPYFSEKASQIVTWIPFLTVYSLEDYVFSLGVVIFSLAVGRMWMKWVYSVFEKRLPSKKWELTRAKGIRFVRILLKGNPDLECEIPYAGMGAAICELAFLIHLLRPG